MKKMFDALRNMNDEYWLKSEFIARKVMEELGKSPEEIEAQMEKVRRQLRYGQIKVEEKK
jgi:hypothetical protein